MSPSPRALPPDSPADRPAPGPRTDPRPVLAVDIGGTKIAAALVDAAARVSARIRIPTPTGTDPDAAWSAVAGAVAAPLAQADARYGGVRGIAVSSAGPLDVECGTISPVMIPVWRDFPVRERAAALVPGSPVALVGDGLCAAIGEHWAGAGRGADDMLGCVVSTGVGGGLLLDGRPWTGRSGNAGHIGHTVIDVGGPPCLCGGRGCLELFASGTALASWAREAGWRGPGRRSTARELSAAARAGDPVAAAAFDRAGRALGAAFASLSAVCELDRIVVGGGVAQAGRVLFEAIEAGMKEFAGLAFLRGVALHPSALGGDACLVGAAATLLAPDRYASRPPSAELEFTRLPPDVQRSPQHTYADEHPARGEPASVRSSRTHGKIPRTGPGTCP
ncbi:ROK family protein [Streptomyces sp. NPDC048516]|uniref:ROK family protein n=1 Tax=Streptomyces sp. NPDC048516 TaxID=3365565 RepID=UPI00371D098C